MKDQTVACAQTTGSAMVSGLVRFMDIVKV
jgi:hypothetical protein